MNYSATFANFDRMVCLKSALAAGISVKITGEIDSYELHFQHSKPKLLADIPSSIVYPYQEVSYHSTYSVAVSDDNEKTLQFNAINLLNIPRRMIVWISEKYSDFIGEGGDTAKNLAKTDTSKSMISNISINYNGRPGILGDADERDLYEISKRNGLLGLSYSQYSNWVGSYLALNFGEENPLAEGEALGTLGSPQLSFTVRFKRIPNSGDITFVLNTAIVYEGTCVVVKDSSVIKQLAVLSGDDVIDAISNGYDIVTPSKFEHNRFGGNPLALLGALSSALPIVRMIKDAVQKGAPIAKAVADGAEKFGLGVVVPEQQKGKKQTKKSGKISGGQLITRSQLSDELY